MKKTLFKYDFLNFIYKQRSLLKIFAQEISPYTEPLISDTPEGIQILKNGRKFPHNDRTVQKRYHYPKAPCISPQFE